MAQYLSMSNGPVNFLVDVNDIGTINDKMADGFYAELDNDGEVILIDSASLVTSEVGAVNDVLNMVKSKQAKLTKTKGLSGKADK